MQHSVFKLPRASAWISSLLREAYLHLSLLHIHVQPGSSQWLLLSALEFWVIAVDVIHNQKPEQSWNDTFGAHQHKYPPLPRAIVVIFAKQIFLNCALAHRKLGSLIRTQDTTLTAENTSVLNPNQIVDFLDFPFHIHFIFIYCNMHNADSK